MAFLLSTQEIVDHHFHTGFSRVLLEQINQAEGLFVNYKPKAHYDIIEEARVCVYKTIAVMELLQLVIGDALKEDLKNFRQFRISLSKHYRDVEVIRAISKLKYLSSEANGSLLFDKLMESFRSNQNSLQRSNASKEQLVTQALALVASAQQTLQDSIPEIHDIDDIAEGLTISHQQMIRCHNNCLHFGADSEFFKLHFAVNRLHHQTEVLQNFPFAPTHFKRKFLERLSSKLDLYSDLTTLLVQLDQMCGSGISYEKFVLFSRIADQQKQLVASDVLKLTKKALKLNFCTGMKPAASVVH